MDPAPRWLARGTSKATPTTFQVPGGERQSCRQAVRSVSTGPRGMRVEISSSPSLNRTAEHTLGTATPTMILVVERKGRYNALETTFANTPEPPYAAVIFTSTRTEGGDGYAAMAEAMNELASKQPGFLGVESARDGVGITVSYWADQAAARAWKEVAAHSVAQRRGREVWYQDYRVRIATVERDYSMNSSLFGGQHGMATLRNATGSDSRRR